MQHRYLALIAALFATTAYCTITPNETSPHNSMVMSVPMTRTAPINLHYSEEGFTPGRVGRWSAYVNKFKSHQALVEHLISFLGEFTGTTMFIFLAFTPVNYINSHAPDAASALLYNSLAFGIALAITARAFGAGHFNPGISLAMALLKIVTPLRAAILAIAQYSGALTGAAVVRLLTGSLQTVTRKSALLSIGQAAVLEGLATAAFVFSFLMVAAKSKRVSIIAPMEIGLSLFITQLVSIGYSGGGLNPARALASDVVAHEFVEYSWLYQVSPYVGGALAACIYKFFEQIQQLQTVVPDLDAGITLAAVTTETDANRHSFAGHPRHARHPSRFDNIDNLAVSPIGQNFPIRT